MPVQREQLARRLFDEYIGLYAARDPRLLARFSENFSGFSGSSDRLVRRRDEWVDMLEHDFAQLPQRIGIDDVQLCVQDLAADVLAATAFFHLTLPSGGGAQLPRKIARTVVLFRREAPAAGAKGDAYASDEDDGAAWKIAHLSVSIPYGRPGGDEVYPIEELRQRNRELETLVQERTEALAQANRRLELLSNTDGLTGIANRRHFDDALAHEWARGQRSGAPLGLVMLDVDRFKHFNDHYGHLAGDACLQALALALAQAGARREGDLAARFGGEEFVLLLPGTTLQAAAEVAGQVQAAIAALALPHEGTPPGVVTVSFGVASLQPGREQQAQELVRRADAALYRAKQAGRDRIEMAPGDGVPARGHGGG